MCDDADLPDHDYASIYGHAALHARTLAQLDALLRKMDTQARTMEAHATEYRAWLAAREAPQHSTPPTDVQDR
jgi:hypothetical protein